MISIIMPVFNNEAALNFSINSIINQTSKDWELLLINDGSSDNSGKICKKFSESYSNIIFLEQENKGAGPARNHGLNHISGEYILFCDADDFLPNNILHNYVEAIKKYKVDLIMSSYQEYNMSNNKVNLLTVKRNNNNYIVGKEKLRKEYVNFYKNNFIQAPWGKLYKSKIIKKNNLEFKNLRRCQDIIFNLEYYEYLNSLLTIDEIGYFYQTPDKIQYISKLPKNLFEISVFVNDSIQKQLKNWNQNCNETITYFNAILFNDLLLCLRLNCLNIWNLSGKEKNIYYKKTIENAKIIGINKFQVKGKINKIIKKVIFSGKILLIDIMFFCILKIQHYVPSIIKKYKNI